MLISPETKPPLESYLRDHDLTLQGQQVFREIIPGFFREEIVLHDGDHIDEALRPYGTGHRYRRYVVRLVSVPVTHRPRTNFKTQPPYAIITETKKSKTPTTTRCL